MSAIYVWDPITDTYVLTEDGFYVMNTDGSFTVATDQLDYRGDRPRPSRWAASTHQAILSDDVVNAFVKRRWRYADDIGNRLRGSTSAGRQLHLFRRLNLRLQPVVSDRVDTRAAKRGEKLVQV